MSLTPAQPAAAGGGQRFSETRTMAHIRQIGLTRALGLVRACEFRQSPLGSESVRGHEVDEPAAVVIANIQVFD